MDFKLGTGFLTMIDRDTGEQFDLGEVAPMEMEVEEWSNKEEPSKTIKGFTNAATFSCENATVNQDLFNELCKPSTSLWFTIERETKILINARWHQKARIRKKWLKRYGYKEDTIKMTAKCRAGEYNTETGESSFDIEDLSYILRPDQLRKGLHIIGV